MSCLCNWLSGTTVVKRNLHIKLLEVVHTKTVCTFKLQPYIGTLYKVYGIPLIFVY